MARARRNRTLPLLVALTLVATSCREAGTWDETPCAAAGESCTGGATCCSGLTCDPATTACAGPCVEAGGSCANGESCCGAAACVNDACIADCSLQPLCVTLGELCGFSGQCCNGNPCLPDGAGSWRCLATCEPLGAPCAGDADCCTGLCYVAGGAGTCSAQVCTADGARCSSDAECCSGSCTKRRCANALIIIEPPGLCISAGDVCQFSEQCCGGGLCLPDGAGLLRCTDAPVPSVTEPAEPMCISLGDFCQFSEQCCGGICVPVGGGLSQCLFVDCAPEGAPCAGPGDPACCGGPSRCVQEGEAGGFACAATAPPPICLPDGQTCTRNVECCPGLVCGIPAGGASGTCQLACVWTGGGCTADGDCCSGTCDVPAGAPSGTCTCGTGN